MMLSSCQSLVESLIRRRIDFKSRITYPTLTLPSGGFSGQLLHSESLGTLSAARVAKLQGREDVDSFARYDIQVHRIYYRSTLRDSAVILSGLLAFPKEQVKLFGHVQYHHATVAPFKFPTGKGAQDVPSRFEPKRRYHGKQHYENRLYILLPASKGYFVSAPDYAGYGISRHLEHPYTYNPELAQQSVDMLLAARDFQAQQAIEVPERLFFTGWSLGAAVAVATQQLVEAHYSQLPLRATAALSGAYNLRRFVDEILQSKWKKAMPLYNWSMYTFLQYGKFDIEPDSIWRYEVQDQYDALALPSLRTARIFQPSFLAQFKSDSSTHAFAATFLDWVTDLSLHEGWTPQYPILLGSSPKDEIVPHFNAEDAYQHWKARDAKAVLKTYKGDHFSNGTPYTKDYMHFFDNQ